VLDISGVILKIVNADDNYLPPDNWQEQPAVGIAHRTSPTNIGLALLSSLCALDLGLCESIKRMGVVENILATVKRLPKWKGIFITGMIPIHLKFLNRLCVNR
jgi:hypothetical protein